MATSPKKQKEIDDYLKRRRELDYKQPIRIIRPNKTKTVMQHDLARNLLIGFLILIIVILGAVHFYNKAFCSNVASCGDNFVNIKMVIDSLFDFGAPFIGIIIGFFFSEKFREDGKDE